MSTSKPSLLALFFLRIFNFSTFIQSSANWHGQSDQTADPVTGITDDQRAITMNLVLSMQTLDQIFTVLAVFMEIYTFRMATQLGVSSVLVALVSIILEPTLEFLAQLSLKPIYKLYTRLVLKRPRAQFYSEKDGTVFTRIQNLLILGTSLGLLFLISPLLMMLSVSFSRQDGAVVFQGLTEFQLKAVFVVLSILRFLIFQYLNVLGDQFLEIGTVKYGKTLKGLVISTPFALKISFIRHTIQKLLGKHPPPRRPVIATDLSFSYARSIPDIYAFLLTFCVFILVDKFLPSCLGFFVCGLGLLVTIGMLVILANERALFAGYLPEDEKGDDANLASKAGSQSAVKLTGFEYSFLLYFVVGFFAAKLSRSQVFPVLSARLDVVSSQFYYYVVIGAPFLVVTVLYVGSLLDKFTPANLEKTQIRMETKPKHWFSEFQKGFGGPLLVAALASGVVILLFAALDIRKDSFQAGVGYGVALIGYILIFGGGLMVRSRTLGFLLSYPSKRAIRITFLAFAWQALAGILLGLPAFLVVFFRSKAEEERTGSVISQQFEQSNGLISMGIPLGYLVVCLVFYMFVDPFLGKYSMSRYVGHHLIESSRIV